MGTAIKLARKIVVQMGDIYDNLIQIGYRIRVWRTKYENYLVSKGHRNANQWYAERLCEELDRLGSNPTYIRELLYLLRDDEKQLIAEFDPHLHIKAERILIDAPATTTSKVPTEPPSVTVPALFPVQQPLSTEQIAKAVSEKLQQDQESKRSEGKRTPRMNELRDEFLQAKIDGSVSDSYRTELMDRTSWFVDSLTYLNGGVVPKTNEITPLMLKEYADLIKKLPAHINKRGGIRHLSREEQIAYLISRTGEQLKQEGFNLIKNRTKNFYFDYALALLNFAEESACLFQENLNKEIQLKQLKEDRDSDKRQAFENYELQLMFESDPYRHASLSKASYYWAPLISLYSGATMAEVLQLYVSDIRLDKEINIWYFNYKVEDEARASGDQRMKNSKSRYRKVPVHRNLKNLHFIEFVEGRRKKGFKKLFPEEKRNNNGKFKNFSSWFNERFKTKFNIKRANGELKDFHNLRHCVGTNLVGHGYDIGIVNSIMGHASKNRNETEQTYSSGLFLSKQNEIVQKIDYGINHNYPKRFIDKLMKEPD